MRRNLAGAALFLFVIAALAASAGGIAPNQLDDFEDGTTASWSEGGPSPNPPTNVSDGGPSGSGDNFLQNVASGGGGPGSRMAMYNRDQWTGDFGGAGVRQVHFDARNLGATDLYLRVAVQGGAGSTQWSSTDAVFLPASGAWTPVVFELNAGAMTRVTGTEALATVLAGVNEFRILSAQSSPDWIGDLVVGILGVDNIVASTVPVELQEFRID